VLGREAEEAVVKEFVGRVRSGVGRFGSGAIGMDVPINLFKELQAW
jgi:hypothetical protein